MGNLVIDENIQGDEKIYRFLTLPTLMTILECDKLDLRRICEWEDPYEVLARVDTYDMWYTYRGPDGSEMTQDESYGFYGMCFSEIESDALWRIYSTNKTGLCIITTPNKFKKAILNIAPNIHACIAKITYDTNKWVEYRNTLSSFFVGRRLDYTKTDIYKLHPYGHACVKRKEFKHEHEIRFIINDVECKNVDDKGIQKPFFSVNGQIKEAIETVVIDPRADKWYCDMISTYLKKHGITAKKSDMYTIPSKK